MPKYLTMLELNDGLPYIKSSPSDHGELKRIVIRPGEDERVEVNTCKISLDRGVHGDRWALGCWKTTDDGQPHPDVQICIMNARCIALIAQQQDNWSPAGDNFFIDMDLTPENILPGTCLAVGSSVIEVTDTPHYGCSKFIERYGRDACVFVNTGVGKQLQLRGVYARVVQDGIVSVGDKVIKTNR